MANVDTTTAANFIPEMWADAILNYAEDKFQIKNLVTDLSSMVANGGDILHIPRATEETAATLTDGNAITYGRNTDPKTDLAINQHAYEAKRITDVVKVQESAELFEIYTSTMGYAIAKNIETYLAQTIIQSASANDTALGTDNILSAAKLRAGIQKLLDINVDYTDGNTFLYASPAAYMNLLATSNFADYDKSGLANSPNVTGQILNVYGMPTFSSTLWDDDGGTGDETASIFTRGSVLFGMQIAPRIQSNYDMDYLATRVVVDVLYGAVLTQGAASPAGQIVNFTNPA